jgi:hypothetical protein
VGVRGSDLLMGGGLSDDLSGYEGDDRIYGGPGQTHGYGEAREYARDLGLKSTTMLWPEHIPRWADVLRDDSWCR